MLLAQAAAEEDAEDFEEPDAKGPSTQSDNKAYPCACGKIFNTSQAKAGHCHFCKPHQADRTKRLLPCPHHDNPEEFCAECEACVCDCLAPPAKKPKTDISEVADSLAPIAAAAEAVTAGVSSPEQNTTTKEKETEKEKRTESSAAAAALNLLHIQAGPVTPSSKNNYSDLAKQLKFAFCIVFAHFFQRFTAKAFSYRACLLSSLP